MKRALVLLYLLAASGAAQAASWSDLWLTHDQQGQRLLDSGKPADAARMFEDARRRAYAQIRAGQYADAAQRLENFRDPQSQYNRGNALARSGKLENALAAYEAAIKQTPADSALGRDARHNRDLVAEQLEKQQSSQSKADGASQPRSGQSGKNGEFGKNEPSQNANQDKQQQGSEQNAANGSQPQQKPPGQGSPGQPPQQRQASTQKQQGSQRESAASEAEKEQQAAANAKRDAAAALAQAKPDEDAKAGQSMQQGDQSKDRNGKPAAAAIDQPPSEQALALEQWLRQIPDDPSGLLRRKFLIEHLKREQELRR